MEAAGKRELVIKPAFITQVKEVSLYIAEESPANADAFLEEVDKAILKIAKHPTANPPVMNFPNKTKRYRYRTVKKSFKIIYKVVKVYIVIVGLLHKNRSDEAYKELRTTNYNEKQP